MNFNKWDIGILVSMSIAVIAMSFMFPALGLTGDETQASEIPEYNISTDRFDFAGEFPERPNQPSRGILNRSSDEFDSYPGQFDVALGDGTSGEPVSLFVHNLSGGVRIINNTQVLDEYDFNTNGNDIVLTGDGYTVTVKMINISVGVAEYQVTERPSGEKWYKGIPVIGGIFDATDQLAAIVGWIGSVIWWTAVTLFEIIINLLDTLGSTTIFLFTLLSWIFGSYGAIVAGANGWAAIIVLIPGILVSLEFVKVVFVLLSLLPTT